MISAERKADALTYIATVPSKPRPGIHQALQNVDQCEQAVNNAQLINQTTGECEYYTPPEIIEAARQTLRGIDLDPASSETANKTVKAAHFKDQHGLRGDWFGRVWLNHPFGRSTNGPWIEKLVREYQLRNVQAACCITYACTSEKWFRPLLYYPQCYLHPRTNYLLPDGTVKKGVTKGSVVTYLGHDIASFAKNFRALGAVKIAI